MSPPLSSIATEPSERMETLEQEFRRLESDWIAGTRALSSATLIIGHPAFRKIIAMGECVIPFMLRDLEARPRLWVWALAEITGVNPVAAEDSGNITKMSATQLSLDQQNWIRRRY